MRISTLTEDEDYDEIDVLLDTDPLELLRRYRELEDENENLRTLLWEATNESS